MPAHSVFMGSAITKSSWKNEPRYGINKWGIAIAFDLRDTDPEQYKFVALHEFGHLIGLRQVEGCSADSSAMTSPYEAGKSPTQPTENDKKGVEKLKAWRDRPRGQ